MFFLISPILIYRLNLHLSLSAHWLILASIYLDLNNGISQKKIISCLDRHYKNQPFIKIAKGDHLLSTNDVINTNNCFISVCKSKYKDKIILSEN